MSYDEYDDDSAGHRRKRRAISPGEQEYDDNGDNYGYEYDDGEAADAATTIARMRFSARKGVQSETRFSREQDRRATFQKCMAEFCTEEFVKTLVLCEDNPALRIKHIMYMTQRISQQHQAHTTADIFLVMYRLCRCIDEIIAIGPRGASLHIVFLLNGVEQPNTKQSITSFLCNRAAEELDIERTSVILNPSRMGHSSLSFIFGAAAIDHEVKPKKSNFRRHARASRRLEEGT